MCWIKTVTCWGIAGLLCLFAWTPSRGADCPVNGCEDEIAKTLTTVTEIRAGQRNTTFMLRPALLGANLQNEAYSFQGGLLRRRFTTDPINAALALVWVRDPNGIDPRKLPDDWTKRINPMVGIPFDRLGDRWYLGLNILVAPGFDANIGFQFEEIDRLSRTAPIGFDNGGLFARTDSSWKTAPFIGVSFDAVQLFDRAKQLFE